MDQNYKRKRKEQRLRQRLLELNKAKTQLDDTKTWSLSDRALRKERVDFWSVMDERKAIDEQILDIERRLLIRSD